MNQNDRENFRWALREGISSGKHPEPAAMDAFDYAVKKRDKIELGPDFPRTEEEIKKREEIAQWLERALACVRTDPIAGNASYCAQQALALMEV